MVDLNKKWVDITSNPLHPLDMVAVEHVSCEPIPEVTYTPEISAEARKEYAERVMAKHKEKKEQA